MLGAPRPHAERGRLPADARDRDGPAAGADHVDDDRLGHVRPGDLRAMDRPHRRRRRTPTPRLDHDALAGDRREASTGDGPARLDVARSSRDRPGRPYRVATASSRSSSGTRTCRTSSPSSAWTSSRTRTSSSSRARKVERFLSQPNFVAEQFTGTPASTSSSRTRSPASTRSSTASTTSCRGGLLHGRPDRGRRREGAPARAGSAC